MGRKQILSIAVVFIVATVLCLLIVGLMPAWLIVLMIKPHLLDSFWQTFQRKMTRFFVRGMMS